jgi:hypothetical protein
MLHRLRGYVQELGSHVHEVVVGRQDPVEGPAEMIEDGI